MAAALVLAAGGLNVLGWLADIPLFVSVLPGWPKMVPATALLVLLGAAGLGWQAWRRTPRGVGVALGLAVLLAGSAMGLAHLLDLPLGPLLAEVVGSQSAASLSSAPTAAMFAAIGLALGLLACERQIVFAQTATMGVALVALLNAGGYLARDTFLYAILPGQGVALPTSASAMALAVGALFLRPEQGIMAAVSGDTPAARLTRRILLAAGVVPLLLGAGAAAGLSAGLYDVGTAVLLLVWGTIVLLTAIVWRVSLQLHKAEAARRHAEAELRRTLQELHAADLRKDVFLTTLAHELRNPLAPLKAVADLLGRGGHGGPGQLQRVSGVIGRQVDHMANLVDDLMDVARVRRGQIVLESSLVDLCEVVDAAHEQARPLIERKDHGLHIDCPPGPVLVLGDRKRLVQVLVNLLTNAAKYTPPGGRLELRLHAAGRLAEIAVRDNGIGIAPALLPTVFELFTQAELTSERGEGGLGLGLALVKRLTELQGGSVSAASSGPGLGSTFTVVLPLAQARPAGAEPTPAAAG